MRRGNTDTLIKQRVDKWLWVARFFKTRGLASEAISKNRIRVGGQKIKASRTVQAGDSIQIEKPPYVFDVTVQGLGTQRRPAAEAQLLYEESSESMRSREQLAAQLRAQHHAQLGGSTAGRPSKKQRRQIIRFQNRNEVPKDDSVDDS